MNVSPGAPRLGVLLRFLAATAALLLAAGMVWFASRPPVASLQRAAPPALPAPGTAGPPTPGTTTGPLTSPASNFRREAVFLLGLSPGVARRAAGSARAVIPHDAKLVRLALTRPAGEAHAAYRAVIHSTDGVVVWAGAPVPARDGTLSADVPAALLSAGDYELALSGGAAGARLEGIADYAFRVLRE